MARTFQARGRRSRDLGKHYRTIRPREDGGVEIIDQTKLPHRFETVTLASVEEAAHAIKAMVVRGAPLISATAAYGMALAMRADASDAALDRAHDLLLSTRPTAVNLHPGSSRDRKRPYSVHRRAKKPARMLSCVAVSWSAGDPARSAADTLSPGATALASSTARRERNGRRLPNRFSSGTPWRVESFPRSKNLAAGNQLPFAAAAAAWSMRRASSSCRLARSAASFLFSASTAG